MSMGRSEWLSLAWYNLTQDWKRLSLYVAGITIAVLLVFVQLGFENALLDSNVLLLDHLDADLLLISSTRRSLVVRDTFSRRRLAEAAAVAGVRSAHALFLDYVLGVLRSADPTVPPEDRKPGRPIRVIGVDPEAGLLRFPELAPGSRQAEELKRPGTALFDRKPRRQLSFFGKPKVGKPFELSGRAIRLVGSFELGRDFGAEGTLVVGEETFHELLRRPTYPGWERDQVEIGLLRLEKGTDVARVQENLRARLDEGDVAVLTPEEFRGYEQDYWRTRTPIGIIFRMGVWMGAGVGALICFQILSGNVYDNLAQYAALLAIGYRRRYLRWLVIQEALILAAAGFIPGWLLAWLSYVVLAWWSDIGMLLTPGWFLVVLVGTVATCLGSGLVALLAVRHVDPGELLR